MKKQNKNKVNLYKLWHLSKRLRDRYNITDDIQDVVSILTRKIVKGECKVVYNCSRNITIRIVEYLNRPIYLVYAKKAHKIKTFLTKDQADYMINNIGYGHYNKGREDVLQEL